MYYHNEFINFREVGWLSKFLKQFHPFTKTLFNGYLRRLSWGMYSYIFEWITFLIILANMNDYINFTNEMRGIFLIAIFFNTVTFYSFIFYFYFLHAV